MKFQSISLLLIMENCLPFTDDVMVVLVQKCVQQTHLLALHISLLYSLHDNAGTLYIKTW